MRGWFIVPAVLLVCGGSCGQSSDSGGLQAGKVKQAEPASAPLAQAIPDAAPLSCSIHALQLEDVSSETVLEQATVHRLLVQRLSSRFGAVGAGESGLDLRVEYLVYRRQSEDDAVFFGARALLKHVSPSIELTWEANATADAPTPAACAAALSGPECRAFVLANLLPRVMDRLTDRAFVACSLESLPSQQVGKLLASTDPWERAQAAKAAGERKLSDLVSPLAQRLDDEEYLVMMSAIGALGRLQSDQAIDPLVKKAQRASPDVVLAIAVALLDLGSPTARKYVQDWSTSHPLTEVKERCTQLLAPNREEE